MISIRINKKYKTKFFFINRICQKIMDGHRHGSSNDNNKKDTGQSNVDHSYAYKNEVSLSINDDQPAVITPTPSPRSYKNEDEIDVTDNVALTKNGGHNKKDETRIGVDNPAFDNTNERKPTASPPNKVRPLSSFGHNNGDSHVKSANGKSPDNQLAGMS